MKKLALLDLDGTLADYDTAMNEGLNSLAGFSEPLLERYSLGQVREDWPKYLQERERMVRSMPGFYRNLKPIAFGFFIKAVLEEMDFSFHIATKAPRHNTAIAAMEKIQWCEEYLPGIRVTIAGDKSLLMADVLVDDYPDYIKPWLEKNPNGLAIMPLDPTNEYYSDKRLVKVRASQDRAFTRDVIMARISQHESLYCNE